MHLNAVEEAIPESSAGLAGRLKRIRQQIGDTINEVRAISSHVRPLVLDDLGLVVALNLLCKDFEKSSRINVGFSTNGTLESILDSNQETAVFRIAQEALANVAKHAAASTVEVRLEHNEGRVRMVIHDNGKGFSPAKPRHQTGASGYGLMNMRERARLLDGSFSIEAANGRGTMVTLEFPIRTAT
jgi:signal transduction histidine kinase